MQRHHALGLIFIFFVALFITQGSAQVEQDTIIEEELPAQENETVEEVIEQVEDLLVLPLAFVNDSQNNWYLVNVSNNLLEAKFSEDNQSLIIEYPANSDKLNIAFDDEWVVLEDGQTLVTPSDVHIVKNQDNITITYPLSAIQREAGIMIPWFVWIAILLLGLALVGIALFAIYWSKYQY
ncbi:hypothetical protein COT72_04695 [archaeon CG10_big_fil_rev_8_21_14_0_10_43_11]|nr:MAG: hypothetical protein COT72_04695 [archaeon CG10_big_fil_rev_8_21_14_0_10_43_11]